MREKLGIIVTTYNRANTAIPTLESLKKNLIYDEGRRFWVIADDGSPEGYVDSLLSVLGTDEEVFVTNSQRRGVGASKNLALKLAFEKTSVVLMSEDDWQLILPYDIRPMADLLVSNPKVGMIRFGYLSSTLSADLVGQDDGYGPMCYWRIKQGSGVYCYSGQIALKNKLWFESVGWHKEGISPGEEELEMCIRYNGTPNAPEILWPANVACHFQTGIFINIGMNNSLNGVNPIG
jgi:glycosyltransferase involved in cell wall biosynthesis